MVDTVQVYSVSTAYCLLTFVIACCALYIRYTRGIEPVQYAALTVGIIICTYQ